MLHIHLKKCQSTQQYLKSYLAKLPKSNTKNILISTDIQTNGHGRHKRNWIQYKDSIALSFKYQSQLMPTLIPLAIGVGMVGFIQNHFNLKAQLKWPNDIFYKNKKIGGIICQTYKSEYIIGIGLNIFNQNNHFDHGFLLQEEVRSKFNAYDLTSALFQYLSQLNFSIQDVLKTWKIHCYHLNQIVFVKDEQFEFYGKFLGIAKNGEALIEDLNSKNVRKILSGSIYPDLRST